MPRSLLFALVFAMAFCSQAMADEAYPAHKVIGNVYYVGSKGLATYLITTPEGHIVINSGFEETVPLIKASVESLGFKMRDIKIVLASHAHSDHVAGHALLKEQTGGKVVVMRGDHDVIASGGVGQYLYGASRWKPCEVDRVLDDGDEVKLGGETLVAHRTPGHTRGCTTWAWQVKEGEKKYNVVVIGSPNVNPGYRLVGNKDYPEIAADYAKTFAVLKKLPCDIFLGAHGEYYGMIAKVARIKTSEKNPFIDPEGYKAYVELKEKAYLANLEDQKAKQAPAPGKEIRIDAFEMAPKDLVADKPTPNKWWLKTDVQEWGAPAGGLLMTGLPNETKTKTGEWVVPGAARFVPYRVPAIVIAPQASGWHRIYVGLYHNPVDPYVAPRLFGRLTREPYPEYLQPPESTKNRYTEVYWKAADLTGQKIHIEQPPAPMPHPGSGYLGGISHVRLVSMTDAEVAAAKQEIELPPAKQRLFGLLDTTDEIFWWGTAETADDIRAIVYRHREAGFGRVYWRAYGSHLDNSLDVHEAAPRWTEAEDQEWLKAQGSKTGWFPYLQLPKKFDPLKVAVEYGQKNDCEVHAWVRFTNHNRPPYANFWHDHPEFSMQELAREKDPKTGEKVPVLPYKRVPYRRVLSLAYPEVRAYYVKFFSQLASTGTKGILIDLLRHPPIAGYEPIVAEAFKKRHGMDLETRDIYHDPLVNELFAEYLHAFLVDLRKAIGPEIEISIRSSGPLKYALSGKKWIEEGLIQTLIDGNWYSGNGPRPTADETVQAAGTKGHAFAIAESSDVDPNQSWQKRPGYLLSPEVMFAMGKLYSAKGVERFGLYESTVYTWEPEIRRAVRRTGWEYERK